MENDVRLARKLRDEKVGKPIVVVILEGDAHAGKHFAVVGKGRAGIQTYFGEGAVAIVVKKKLLYHVVGDKDIRVAIAIIAGQGYAQCFTFFGGDSGSSAHVFKRAIYAIAIQDLGDFAKF